MSSFLVDTNVISEVAKPFPAPQVARWLDQASPMTTYTSVITLGELRIGIEGLALGKRRTELEAWLESGLPTWFSANLLPVSREISDVWGRLTIRAKRNGTPLAMADGLIAATAVVHRLTVVTRNTSHFTNFSVQLLDPWTI